VTVGRERRFRDYLLGTEARRVTVAEFDPVNARRSLRQREDLQIRIKVGRILQALPGLKIHAGGVLAALAQPQRVDRLLRAIRALEHQLRRRAYLEA
jgi:hypothetical protein